MAVSGNSAEKKRKGIGRRLKTLFKRDKPPPTEDFFARPLQDEEPEPAPETLQEPLSYDILQQDKALRRQNLRARREAYEADKAGRQTPDYDRLDSNDRCRRPHEHLVDVLGKPAVRYMRRARKLQRERVTGMTNEEMEALLACIVMGARIHEIHEVVDWEHFKLPQEMNGKHEARTLAVHQRSDGNCLVLHW